MNYSSIDNFLFAVRSPAVFIGASDKKVVGVLAFPLACCRPRVSQAVIHSLWRHGPEFGPCDSRINSGK